MITLSMIPLSGFHSTYLSTYTALSYLIDYFKTEQIILCRHFSKFSCLEFLWLPCNIKFLIIFPKILKINKISLFFCIYLMSLLKTTICKTSKKSKKNKMSQKSKLNKISKKSKMSKTSKTSKTSQTRWGVRQASRDEE